MDLDNPFRAEMAGKGQHWTLEALDHLMANISGIWSVKHEADGTHTYFTDDSSGISLEPSTINTGIPNDYTAYSFDCLTGFLGISGLDSPAIRSVTLTAQWDGAATATHTSQVYLFAKYNPTTGTAQTASMSLSAISGSGQINITASTDITIVAPVTVISAGTLSLFGSTKVVINILDVDDSLNVDGATNLKGPTVIDDTLNVTGAVDLDSTLNVDGTVNIEGATEIDDTLNVTGLATVISGFKVASTNFSSLPAGVLGMLATVTDSGTNTWGATVTGGGPTKVLAFYNGTNWTCVGI